MTTSEESVVVVGRLGRTRGVGGHIWVTPLTDFPERFEGMTEIMVHGLQGWQTMKLNAAALIGGRPVLHFEGIDSREQAARLTNRDVGVRHEQLVSLPEGHFFVFELVGVEVFAEDDGEKIGKIVDVRQYPTNDVYVIESPDGRQMVLAVVKAFVNEIDIEGRRVVVDRTGLLDV